MRFFIVATLLFSVLICASPYKHGLDLFIELADFLDSIPRKCQPRANSLPPNCLEHIKWGTENLLVGPIKEQVFIGGALTYMELEKVEIAKASVQKIIELPSKLDLHDLVAFSSLKEKYRLSSLMKNCHDLPMQDNQLQPGNDEESEDRKSYAVTAACGKLTQQREAVPLSVKDVCSTMSNCSAEILSSEKNGCTVDNKCDVRKAFPLMAEIFFYKVAFAIVDSTCGSAFCPGGTIAGCKLPDQITSISKQVKLMDAFVNMMPENTPYDSFYRKAVGRKAFSRVNEAMQFLTENEQTFADAEFACEEIEAEPACHLLTIRPHYLLLKKMKGSRLQPGYLGDTRDLRLHQNVDHAKMLHLKKDAIAHAELLGTVNQLNTNLQVHIQGMSSYFKGIAEYEQGIASADRDFIHGKLTSFNTKYDELADKVHDKLKDAMIAMETSLTAALVEETAALVAKIAQEANPVKAIFSGVDTQGVRDQAKVVAKLAADVAKGGALIEKLKDVQEDTIEIALDFQDNGKQIAELVKLVNGIVSGSDSAGIEYDAEGFVDEYAAYTPKVDESRMAKNIALWGALKDSTCELLNELEGLITQVAQMTVNIMLLCENLEGTVAEFNALRENIFEFQFELVDTLARVVRSNLATNLADSIGKQETDLFQAHELFSGFLMTQLFIQSQAWLYCDKLEYLNEGQRVYACSPQTGLFTNDGLDNLVAFTDHQSYISVDRTVFIPSRPQNNGDLGFINIPKLAKEKSAYFKLPRNKTWLLKNGWGLIGETHAPYVENFQLFLPTNTTKAGNKTSTRIVVSADPDAGCYISTKHTNPVRYKLPESQTSYVTLYEEGYRSSTCFENEITNPYSLCNNLPKVCHRSSKKASYGLLPTILSGWRVTYTVQEGNEETEWLAPQPVTNLFFIAKLKLRLLSRSLKRSRTPNSPLPNQQDVCCPANEYRSSLVSSVCAKCPEGSESKMGGYYCQAKTNGTAIPMKLHKGRNRH